MRAPSRTPVAQGLVIHHAVGPPRVSAILSAGRRVGELEVAGGAASGSVRLRDGRSWSVSRPPGSGEWWVVDDAGHVVTTLVRRQAFGANVRISCRDAAFDLRPVGAWWRRRWEVREPGGAVVLAVDQRLFARPVHDLSVRRGDLPMELVWVVAWWLAARASRGVVPTRRPRWRLSGR